MHANHHRKAIELGFGKRKYTLLLHWVLRGQDPKRIIQPIGVLSDRHLPLLHGFEQGALCFLRSAVDFIRQNDIGKDRSFFCSELTRLAVVYARPQNVSRQHVRRKLNTLKAGVDAIGDS